MIVLGGGYLLFQSLSTIKKGTSPLNFKSNELFLKSLRQFLLYVVSWSKKNKKIVIYWTNIALYFYNAIKLPKELWVD